MHKIKPTGKENIVYSGKIFSIVEKEMQIGEKIKMFEVAKRSPGVRLIIFEDEKILLTKEYRHEIESFDYRLPGGKVFDTLEDYQEALANNIDILDAATSTAKKECLEEVGLKVKSVEYFRTSTLGATMEWDLYYFLITKFTKAEQQLEAGEYITPEWFTKEQVKKMCLDGTISEERSAMVLLQFLEK